MKADYGIDAPDVVRRLVLAGLAALLVGVVLYVILRPSLPDLATGLLIAAVFSMLGLIGSATSMVWSSRVGKLRARDRLIGSIEWRGDENVLDVGCGRGLLLIAAARQLTSGTATGVDIWDPKDQSGNRPETPWENARLEGVADRIKIKDADARLLPFPDASFDVVVSSLVLHNIPHEAPRRQALGEMVRVLKPGGQMAILDVAYSGEYAMALRELGMREVKLSRPMYVFSPLARIVTARK